MITIMQANNTSDVTQLIKPDVTLIWVNNYGTTVDGFSRDIYFNEKHLFDQALSGIQSTETYSGRRLYRPHNHGYSMLGARVFIAAVVAQHTHVNNNLNRAALRSILANVADAMREQGMKSVVLPNISTNRITGIRTSNFLEIVEELFTDLDVTIATAVPLQSHGKRYVDIRNETQNPKIEVRRRVAVPTHGWIYSVA
jgi:hypothetical protein